MHTKTTQIITKLAARTVPLSAMTLAVGLALGLAHEPEAQAQSDGPTACEDLASQAFPNTRIGSAVMVAAGAMEPPTAVQPGPPPPDYSRLPAFCRITGSIHPTDDSDIRFELWLPTEADWNGRFLQTGNGGAAGSIVIGSLADPLTRGYAVANTDTGHQGGGGEFGWAVGHPEKLVDYQHRAVHELTVVGKAITAARFGRAADESFWLGCSTGGRQGLKEAQRYPDDYDAIVAGAPAANWAPLMGQATWIQANIGPGALGPDKLSVLKEAAIAACDAEDGVEDRVISNPAECDFDPGSLRCPAGGESQCLDQEEVRAARRIYAGLVAGNGQVLMPGTGPGSEPLWGAYAGGPFTIGTNYFRDVVLNDPEWDPAEFDVDTHVALAEEHDQGAAKAMDPDLSAFVENGGRLLLYHGTTDGLIPYGNTVRYYEDVVETMGAAAVEDSVRLFLVPGMDHCAGGEGAFAIDWLTALEEWVDTGEAPDVLAGMHPAGGPPAGPAGAPGAEAERSTTFTRPICAYPEVATYDGSGDPDAAESFECEAP